MRLARHTGLVLLMLMALSQLAANQTAAAAPRKSANTVFSNQTIYRVTCQDPSNDYKPKNRRQERTTPHGPAGVAATPPAPVTNPAGETQVSTPPSLTTSETESFSLWSDCEDCNPIRHHILGMMLAIVWMFLPAVAVQHLLSSLSNRTHWRKLEGAIREYVADKDLDKLAGSCRLCNLAAATPVIAAIAAEANVGHPTTLIKLERLKHAGRSATRNELRKWTSSLNFLDSLVCVSLILLAAWALSDLATSLNDLAQAEGAAGGLLLGLRQGFPVLWSGLVFLVMSIILKQIILSRVNRLELRIKNLSIDFIVGLMSAATRRPCPKYRPGMWMTARALARNRRAPAPAIP